MKIIKLDAIDSTNTFLREMSHDNSIDNFTVVVAKNQVRGRGQMNAIWESENGKNLTFSILLKFNELHLSNQFYISKIVSLAVYNVLSTILTVNIDIKWPNDILAEEKKIGGILIENSVKKANIFQSIIGIGLNVNQEAFKNLPNATSMKLISKENYALENLLEKLVNSIKKYFSILNKKDFKEIDKLYIDRLYKIHIPAMFKNTLTNEIFMGKIVGVSKQGQLNIELEDETVSQFSLKEIEFLK